MRPLATLTAALALSATAPAFAGPPHAPAPPAHHEAKSEAGTAHAAPSTEITDSKGINHVLSSFFVKSTTASTYDVGYEHPSSPTEPPREK